MKNLKYNVYREQVIAIRPFLMCYVGDRVGGDRALKYTARAIEDVIKVQYHYKVVDEVDERYEES